MSYSAGQTFAMRVCNEIPDLRHKQLDRSERLKGHGMNAASGYLGRKPAMQKLEIERQAQDVMVLDLLQRRPAKHV